MQRIGVMDVDCLGRGIRASAYVSQRDDCKDANNDEDEFFTVSLGLHNTMVYRFSLSGFFFECV